MRIKRLMERAKLLSLAGQFDMLRLVAAGKDVPVNRFDLEILEDIESKFRNFENVVPGTENLYRAEDLDPVSVVWGHIAHNEEGRDSMMATFVLVALSITRLKESIKSIEGAARAPGWEHDKPIDIIPQDEDVEDLFKRLMSATLQLVNRIKMEERGCFLR